MTSILKNLRIKLRTNAAGKNALTLTKEAKLLVKVGLILALAVFVIVGLRAYTAKLQYENNALTQQNEYLQAEIDSLESQIAEETKVTSIEKTATKKYGMVYPTADNYIVIKEKKSNKSNNLASRIKNRAYN